MMKEINFKMFGRFYLNYDNRQYDVSEMLGRQLSSLVAYFVYYRNRIVSKDMLISAFWPESENPNSAIKYAIFRLRNELAKTFDFDWIITSKMGYMLNPELDVVVDLDKFEDNYSKLLAEKKFSDLEFLDEMTGEFLEEFDDEWILSIREYFSESKNKAIVTICDEEFRKGSPNYAEIIQVCKSALEINQYSESLIYFYCRSLIETRDYNKALTYFEKTKRKFQDELGIPLSDNIRELFTGAESEVGKTVRIDEISKDFEEDSLTNGPLFCSQLTFKKLYQIYVRKARRDNSNYHILLFEIKSLKANKQDYLHEALENILVESLRRTDIYTSFTTNNFGILVEVKQSEDIFVVIERIQKKFYAKVNSKVARLLYHERSLNKVEDANHFPTIDQKQ